MLLEVKVKFSVEAESMILIAKVDYKLVSSSLVKSRSTSSGNEDTAKRGMTIFFEIFTVIPRVPKHLTLLTLFWTGGGANLPPSRFF